MKSLMIGASQMRLRMGPKTPFQGEVLASDFITGTVLATAVGLTSGSSIGANDTTPWLVFADPVDGKTKYVPKRPLRSGLKYTELFSAGVVDGNKTVTIKGKVYKVRLFNGGATSFRGSAADPAACYGSEWNRLMYRISGSSVGLSGEGIEFGQWAKISDDDLGIKGFGGYTWCQEPYLYRGNDTHITQAVYTTGTVTHRFGWRPVLELID